MPIKRRTLPAAFLRLHYPVVHAMIKKIDIDQLTPGMYVHDLNVDWMSHPFLRKRFLIEDASDVSKICAAGIRELYIDTSRGLDVINALTEAEVRQKVEQEMLKVAVEQATPISVSTAEEMIKAHKIYEQAGAVVRSVMRGGRLGRAVEIAEVESVVEDITASVSRNSGALISLLRLKQADDYTFLHCVARDFDGDLRPCDEPRRAHCATSGYRRPHARPRQDADARRSAEQAGEAHRKRVRAHQAASGGRASIVGGVGG